MSVLLELQRKALLPIIEFREENDPPKEVVREFQLHDLLLFVGFLRQRGIEFQTREEVQAMPHLYARAGELIKVDEPEQRYKGVVRHPVQLLLTKRHGKRLRPQSKGPEVVAMLRELYSEGYKLVTPVLQREVKNLYIPMTFLGANTMDVDFSYVPSIPNALTLDDETEYHIRRRFEIPRSQTITSREISLYLTDDTPLRAAILAAGIDVFTAEKEVEEQKGKLIWIVRQYLGRSRVVPTEIVKELRKLFPGRNDFELRYSVVDAARRQTGEAQYTGRYTQEKMNDLFDPAGFEGMGSRNFGYANPERPLEVRCMDAFIRMYQQTRGGVLDARWESTFAVYFRYLYHALERKYGDWNRALIAFYGWETIRFPKIRDDDLASCAVPEVADALRVGKERLETLSGLIRLPLIYRETRTFPYLHQEHVTLLLERAEEQFRQYQGVRAT